MRKTRISLTAVMRGTMYLLSLNLLVFLRRQFGERVVGDLCIACGLSWFCCWLCDVARMRMFPLFPEPRLTPFFLYALSALTACHLFCIWLRRNKPATIHSRSTGRAIGFWRFLRVNDVALQRYVQPGACLLAAVGLSRWDRALAYWIGAASVAMFAEEQFARFQMRRRVLDTIDSRIEAQMLYKRVQERISPTQAAVAQFPVIEIVEASRRKTGKLKNIMARLDPELRNILESTVTTDKEKPE